MMSDVSNEVVTQRSIASMLKMSGVKQPLGPPAANADGDKGEEADARRRRLGLQALWFLWACKDESSRRKAAVRDVVVREAKRRWEERPNQASVAPISPFPDEGVAEALPLLELGPDDVLCDIGCGDGRWVIEAARRYGCRGVGIDIDRDRLALARARTDGDPAVAGRVELREADLSTAPVGDATKIVFYLWREALDILGKDLKRRARPGTLVMSVQFRMPPPWVPFEVHCIRGRPVHMYRT
eukprot:g3836.t1